MKKQMIRALSIVLSLCIPLTALADSVNQVIASSLDHAFTAQSQEEYNAAAESLANVIIQASQAGMESKEVFEIVQGYVAAKIQSGELSEEDIKQMIVGVEPLLTSKLKWHLSVTNIQANTYMGRKSASGSFIGLTLGLVAGFYLSRGNSAYSKFIARANSITIDSTKTKILGSTLGAIVGSISGVTPGVIYGYLTNPYQAVDPNILSNLEYDSLVDEE